MEPQQTAATYDKIGHHWAGDEFNSQDAIAQHRRALQFLTAAGTGRAIDVGCGSSGRIIDLLLSSGLEVEGLDISTTMLELARAKHPGVRFHQGDICTWEFPGQYDFISAWDSIWHVPLERHPAVLQKLCAALNPGGVLIFTTGGVDAPHDVTNPDCHGQPLYHAALGIPQLLKLVDEFECVCRHLEYDQQAELHVYLIVQKCCPEAGPGAVFQHHDDHQLPHLEE
jgi:SAM-dependent methyltransferase